MSLNRASVLLLEGGGCFFSGRFQYVVFKARLQSYSVERSLHNVLFMIFVLVAS